MKAVNWVLKGAVALLEGDASTAGHLLERAHAGLVAAGHEAQALEGTIAFATAAKARGLELDAAWATSLSETRKFAERAAAGWWLEALERIGPASATATIPVPPKWTRPDVLKLITPLVLSYFDSLATAATSLSEKLGPHVALETLDTLARASVDGGCSEERFWSFAPTGPYAARRLSLRERMSGNVAEGLAEPSREGWRITGVGRDMVERLRAAARAEFAARAPDGSEQLWLAETMENLAARVTRDGERASSWRAIGPVPRPAAAVPVRIVQAGLELFSYRDDCHIGAWSRAGYDGPTLSVLTVLWNGRQSAGEVVKAVRDTHLPEDVDRCIAILVARGDAEREGDIVRLTDRGQASRDAIEAETDERYFAYWPAGEALERLAEPLSAFIGALSPMAGGG